MSLLEQVCNHEMFLIRHTGYYSTSFQVRGTEAGFASQHSAFAGFRLSATVPYQDEEVPKAQCTLHKTDVYNNSSLWPGALQHVTLIKLPDIQFLLPNTGEKAFLFQRHWFLKYLRFGVIASFKN